MMWEPQLPGYDLSLDNPDIALVDALIDRLDEELCLDLARVYATGFCVGAAGTSVLGCVFDDRLAAVAPVSVWAVDLGDACNTERPVPVLAVHGTRDTTAPFEGGVEPADWFLDTVLKDGSRLGDSAWGQWMMSELGLSVPDYLTATAERYGCEPEPSVEPLGEADHYVWACPDDAAVELVAHGGGHTWLSTTDGRTTEQLIWDFFEQHPMPE
jgi:polyhydroxybutyrate depolymerase